MTWFGRDVGFADTPALDSFQRLRISQSFRLFDAQQEYGLDTLRTWDAAANGTLSYATGATDGSVTNGSNAVGPTNTSTRMTPITVSTTNGHYSILQSRQYTRYIPGYSHLVLMTGVFASGSSYTAKLVRRTSTSGSPVEEEVSQSSWNIDKFDGTGPSGITLDLTKTQILFIGAQWLGVGRVIMGFDIDGRLWPAHEFLHANVLALPYTQTFNLPVRYEIRNTGVAESKARGGYFDHANGFYLETTRAVAGGTINMVCCTVQSEGAREARGFPRSIGNGTTTIGVTSRRPILSIRPKATYNSRTNRAHIEVAEFDITAATNNAFIEVVVGGTLTTGGVASVFTSVGTDSCAEYNVTADAISGGTVIKGGYAISGAGVVRGVYSGEADIRNPLVLSQIDALTATQVPITLVATSFTGTSNLSATFNWHEQTI